MASRDASPAVFLGLLTAGSAFAMFGQGGIDLFDWNICLSLIGLAGLVYSLVTPRAAFAPGIGPLLRFAGILFPCYVALQLLPMPLWALRVLSPERLENLNRLESFTRLPHAAALTVLPEATSTHLFRILGYALTFLLIREIVSRSARQWPWLAVVPLLALALLEAILGLFQKQQAAEVQGTYGSRDHFSGLLEMILPLAVAYGCALFQDGSATKILKGCLALAVATCLFTAIAFSLSKMAFVSCIGGVFVTGALVFGGSQLLWKKTAVFSLLLASLSVFIWLPPPELLKAFGELENDPSGEGRVPIWGSTLKLIGDYPLLGSGLGTYDSAFLKYQTTSVESGFEFAHNDYLQLAAELGSVGFVIASILMLSVLALAVSAARSGSDDNTKYLGAGCVGGIAAILLHSFADFNLYIPANALVLAWISGIAAGLPQRSQTTDRSTGRAPFLIMGLLLIVFAPAWILFDTAFSYDWHAEKRFCRFGICDTDAVVSAQAILHQGNIAAVPAPLLIEALSRDSNNPHRWSDLGEAMLRTGDRAKAHSCFSNALRLGPADPAVLVSTASYFFLLHQPERALPLMSRLQQETPSFDDTIFDAYAQNKLPVDQVVTYGLPPMQRAYAAYLQSLMGSDSVENAVSAWRALDAKGYADSKLANQYVEFLIKNQQPGIAAEAWAAYNAHHQNGYLQSTWLYNGGFELDPSGSALDWKIDSVAGVDIAADQSVAQTGARSLRIHFGGQDNISFSQIHQTAVVSPGNYLFEAYIRTEALTTDQGLSFKISGNGIDVQTEQVTGTNAWKKLARSFCVPARTKLVEVQVTRLASWKFDNKISGTAWIDSVRLSKLDGATCRSAS